MTVVVVVVVVLSFGADESPPTTMRTLSLQAQHSKKVVETWGIYGISTLFWIEASHATNGASLSSSLFIRAFVSLGRWKALLDDHLALHETLQSWSYAKRDPSLIQSVTCDIFHRQGHRDDGHLVTK